MESKKSSPEYLQGRDQWEIENAEYLNSLIIGIGCALLSLITLSHGIF